MHYHSLCMRGLKFIIPLYFFLLKLFVKMTKNCYFIWITYNERVSMNMIPLITLSSKSYMYNSNLFTSKKLDIADSFVMVKYLFTEFSLVLGQ